MLPLAAGCAPCDDVLPGLLHFVSQPLTTLHCALEHSLGRNEEQKLEDVFIALEQTERVIEAVRLMRDYLEVERGPSPERFVPVSQAIETVLEDLSGVAQARGVKLFVGGASKASIAAPEYWLRRAFVYMIDSLIERVPSGEAIVVLLEDGISQSVISAYGLPIDTKPDAPVKTSSADSIGLAKVAIARRVFESSGAKVKLDMDGKPGFTIHLGKSAVNQLSA